MRRCRSHSTILPSLAATSSVSRASTPSSSATSSHTLQANGGSSSSLAALNGTSGTRTPSSGVGGSTGIGSGSGKPDGNGNVFFECLNCGRPVSTPCSQGRRARLIFHRRHRRAMRHISQDVWGLEDRVELLLESLLRKSSEWAMPTKC